MQNFILFLTTFLILNTHPLKASNSDQEKNKKIIIPIPIRAVSQGYLTENQPIPAYSWGSGNMMLVSTYQSPHIAWEIPSSMDFTDHLYTLPSTNLTIPLEQEIEVLQSNTSTPVTHEGSEPKRRKTDSPFELWDYNQKNFLDPDVQDAFNKQLKKLKLCKKVYLSKCKLRVLPEALFNLTYLNVLDLSNNDFSTTIIVGTKSENPLWRIPEFRQLRNLFLNNCHINTLPLTFQNFKKLKRVELIGNALNLSITVLQTKYFLLEKTEIIL